MNNKRKGSQSGSELKIKKLDKGALGIYSFEIDHNYKPYSILNRSVQNPKTKQWVEHNNKEKPKELLDYLLNMGNAQSFKVKTDQEAKEAIDMVFESDHSWAKDLLNGQIAIQDLGTKAIPEIFLSKVPDVLDYDEFSKIRKAMIANVQGMSEPPIEKFQLSKQAQNARYTHENNVPVPKDHERHGDLSGDKWERYLYYTLKRYFEDTKDACLIIHGHSFLHENNFKEKDFIVLNLSKGYIMNIEVKASPKQFDHAKEQIKDCRKRIQAVLECIPGMSSLWKFIGVCCIGDGRDKNDFVINGSDLESSTTFEMKLGHIEKQLDHLSWSPNEERIREFVNIAKHLLFVAQGQCKAPLTKAKLTERVAEDLDKASAPETILFWTPEQLSIVQAMHMDWMFLMGYYGCGKTILLIERAEYLLRNPRNIVHFYIDTYKAQERKLGLVQDLKLKFEGKNIKIMEKINIFDDDNFDISVDGVEPTDVIIDECVMSSSERLFEQLKKLQSQVSSLWVALGDVSFFLNFDESDFRRGLQDIQFYCPTLTRCLRNGQKIVELAKKDDNCAGLNHFKLQVEVNSRSNVNDGLLHIMPLIYPNPIIALQEAFKVHHSSRNFIFLRKDVSTFKAFKKAFPDHDFLNYHNKEELKQWLESSNMNQHLVFQGHEGYNSEVSGMEFQSMIYMSAICLKCAYQNLNHSIVITRAKASLMHIRYESQNCNYPACFDKYPKRFQNLNWNKEDKKWEIDKGITMDQLPENTKRILKETSALKIFKP